MWAKGEMLKTTFLQKMQCSRKKVHLRSLKAKVGDLKVQAFIGLLSNEIDIIYDVGSKFTHMSNVVTTKPM